MSTSQSQPLQRAAKSERLPVSLKPCLDTKREFSHGVILVGRGERCCCRMEAKSVYLTCLTSKTHHQASCAFAIEKTETGGRGACCTAKQFRPIQKDLRQP